MRGFAGTKFSNIEMGTMGWRWLDDHSMEHKFRMPNSHCVPEGEGKVRLLSLQHWAKAVKRAGKNSTSTGETTHANRTKLFWNNYKHKLTIPIAKSNNVVTFSLAPGHAKYHAFCAMVDNQDCDNQSSVLVESNIVSDDNNDNEAPIQVDQWRNVREEVSKGKKQTPFGGCTFGHYGFNMNGKCQGCAIMQDKEDNQKSNDVAESLCYHQKFHGVSFTKLQTMS